MTYSTAVNLSKTFAIAIAVMCVVLIAANSIPNRPIIENVRSSISYLGNFHSPAGAPIDDFTECVAVSVGLFSGHNVNSIGEAFLSPTTKGCPLTIQAIEGGSAKTTNYWRFWHGYQVISRPLLYFAGLRTLHHLVFIGFCISAFIFYEAVRAHIGPVHATIAIASLLCISMPIYSGVYLVSHAVIWFTAFLGSAWLLSRNLAAERTASDTLLALFLLLGMTTSFLGYLTTPLVTLTIPLLVFYWAGRRYSGDLDAPPWRTIGLLCLVWAVGYAGCWAMKWAIASIVFNADFYGEVIAQISLRMSGETNTVAAGIPQAPVDASFLNSYAHTLMQVRYGLLGLAGYFAYRLLRALWEQRRPLVTNPFRSVNDTVACGLIFALPLLWIGVVRNHTVNNPHFVPAILYTCFALGFWVIGEAVGAAPAPCAQRA